MTVYELMCLHIDLVWNDRRKTTKNGYRTWKKYMDCAMLNERAKMLKNSRVLW